MVSSGGAGVQPSTSALLILLELGSLDFPVTPWRPESSSVAKGVGQSQSFILFTSAFPGSSVLTPAKGICKLEKGIVV